MYKKLPSLVLAFILCGFSLLFTLPVNAQSANGGAAVRADLFTMPPNGYFQNPEVQQKTSNISVGTVGLNQLQQNLNNPLVVDSPIVAVNSTNNTSSNDWVVEFLVAIGVFALLAVVVYALSIAEKEVKEVSSEILAEEKVSTKTAEAPVETPVKPKKTAKKSRTKHGRPAKKKRR